MKRWVLWIWAACIGFWAIAAIIIASVLYNQTIVADPNFYFNVSPEGFSLECTNLTGPVGTQKIKQGNFVNYYNTCPSPRSPCETALCNSDGKCVVVFSPSSTCASNADCATQFDDSRVTCDIDTCSCVQPIVPPCCDWIDFQPAGYSFHDVNTAVNASASSFKWRRSATHIEMNGRVEFQNITTTFVIIDISNIGVNLVSNGTYWGIGGGGMICQNNTNMLANNQLYSSNPTHLFLDMRFTTSANNPMCSFSFFYYSIIQ